MMPIMLEAQYFYYLIQGADQVETRGDFPKLHKNFKTRRLRHI